MDLTSYISIQNQIKAYRNNLHRLEDRLAAHGGYIFTPIDVQNQYDQTKVEIDRLVKDLHQIERRMINEISVIRDAFEHKDLTIADLNQEIHRLNKKIEEQAHEIQSRDNHIEEQSWKPVTLKTLTPQQRKQAYEDAQAFAHVITAYGNDLAEDYKTRRVGLNRIIKLIIEEYNNFYMNLRKYY